MTVHTATLAAASQPAATRPEALRFLDRNAVRTCLAEVDVLDVVARTLCSHAEGASALPAEGYLPWSNGTGDYTRAIAMLGAVGSGAETAYGMKLINASVGNPRLGMERAGGLSFLFDPETARPIVMAEAALMSAMRTAGYTMLSARHLGPHAWTVLGIIGCGTLARAHVDLVVRVFPDVTDVHFHDTDPRCAAAFGAWLAAEHPQLHLTAHESAREVAGDAQVLVTLTTSSTPYMPAAWFAAGSLVAHVSLDDLMPDALLAAEALYVDDVGLVRDNPRRILGRLMHEGAVSERGTRPAEGGRPLDGTLGDILLEHIAPHRPASGYVVSNPFGMAILDVGLLHAVAAVAEERKLGQTLILH